MSEAPDSYLGEELDDEPLQAMLDAGAVDLDLLVQKHIFDGRTHVRRNASRLLLLGGGQGLPHAGLLAVAGKDGDRGVRENMIRVYGLTDQAPADIVPALLNAVCDPVEALAEEAERSLGKQLLRSAAAVAPLLVEALGDRRPIVSATVRELLSRGGAEAVGPLVGGLGHPRSSVRSACFSLLGRYGDGANVPLIEALADPALRPRAERLLAKVAYHDGELSQLQALVAGADSKAAATAARLLRAAGRRPPPPPPPIAIPGFFDGLLEGAVVATGAAGIAAASLTGPLAASAWQVRANAARLAGYVAGVDPLAIGVLLRDEEPEVRRAALESVARLKGPAAVAMLVDAAADASEEVAELAREALCGVGGSPEELLQAIRGRTPEAAREAVVEALVAGGAASAQALAAALPGLELPDARLVGVTALGRLVEVSAAVAAALVASMRDPDARVRAASARALGVVGAQHQGVRGALGEAQRDPIGRVRRAAGISLTRLDGRGPARTALDLGERLGAEFEQGALDEAGLAAALGALGVPRLCRALSDGRVVVRRNAAAALGGAEGAAEEATRGLELALKDAEPTVREVAVIAVAKLGAARATRLLLVSSADPARPVARRAQAALQDAGLAGAAGLLEQLHGSDQEAVRQAAVATCVPIAYADPEAFANRLATIAGAAGRAAGLDAIKRLGPAGAAATSGLVPLLSDERPLVRAAAVLALAAVGGSQDPQVASRVRSACGDGSPVVKRAARLALERLDRRRADERPETSLPAEGFDGGGLAHEALARTAATTDVGALAALLADGRAAVRRNAAVSLGTLGAGAAPALAPLLAAALDAEPAVREAALVAVGGIGQADPAAVAVLTRALGDRHRSVASAANNALLAMGPGAVQPLLAALPGAGRAAIFARVVDILVAGGAAAVPSLAEALEGARYPASREAAAAALARVGEAAEQAADALVRALDDAHEGVREAAARALGKVGVRSKMVSDALGEAAKDSVLPVRRAAARAQAELAGRPLPGARGAIEPEPLTAGMEEGPLDAKGVVQAAKLSLARLLAALTDGRAVVRLNAALAIGALKKKGADAVPRLLLALKDSDLGVRVAAVQALVAVGADPALAVPALVASLRRAPEALEDAVVAAIGALGADGPKHAMVALDARPEEVIDTVGRLARREPDRYVPALAEVVASERTIARENAVDLISDLRERGQEAEFALLGALGIPDLLFRVKVLGALGRVAAPTEACIEALEEIGSNDPRSTVRYAARDALRYLRSALRRQQAR